MPAEWFVALPDDARCDQIAARLPADRRVLATHSCSSRPWIIGRWDESDLSVGRWSDGLAACLGHHDRFDGTVLPGSWDDLFTWAAQRRGNSFFLATDGQVTKAVAPVTRSRRLYSALVNGLPVIGSSSARLAHLTGAGVVLARLASRLMWPICPSPVEESPLFAGVRGVRSDSWLAIDKGGNIGSGRWWEAPTPQLGLREGAALFGEELRSAVSLRATGRASISADLSGGLDSTPLCFLAYQSNPAILLFTSGARSGENDDMRWADLAASYMPVASRLVVEPQHLPAPFESMDSAPVLTLDEPFSAALVWRRIARTAELLTASGSTLHLAGHGGDEVLVPSEASLFRPQSIQEFRRLFQVRAAQRWRYRDVIGRLADRRGYGHHVAEIARRKLELDCPDHPLPPSVWGSDGHYLPPWITPAAKDLIADEILSYRDQEPLDNDPPTHASMDRIQASGRVAGQIAEVMANFGMRLATPLLDDRVALASLRTNSADRDDPKRFKPLMIEATTAFVPGPVLRRHTKSHFTRDNYLGRQEHQENLLALCHNSRLAELGLVDVRRLRDACLGSYPQIPLIALARTLTCEMWLRARE